jgi:hypothetical protein
VKGSRVEPRRAKPLPRYPPRNSLTPLSYLLHILGADAGGHGRRDRDDRPLAAQRIRVWVERGEAREKGFLVRGGPQLPLARRGPGG